MKHIYLRQMLEWKIGLDTHWLIPVISLGKRLGYDYPPDLDQHVTAFVKELQEL